MLLLRILFTNYQYAFNDLADPRVKNFLLMDSPFPVIIVIGLYLTFVLKWGPNMMKNREPYNLKYIMIVYNLIQIMSCFYLVVIASYYLYFSGEYNLLCEPVNYSNDYIPTIVVNGSHWYFLLKVLDLLDTIFFVLRKKSQQVSFLHVYHHTGIVALSWLGVKYVPGGHSILTGYVNAIVHVFMYTYYLLAVIYPKNENLIWAKKYITQLQIVQFFLMLLHWISLYIHPFCGFPKFPSAILIPQFFFMLALFSDFYYKTYIKKQKQS